jgi:outer membrane protein assembly factor BamB
VWKYTTGDDVASSPAVADGVVFVGSNDKKLYALNATSGARLWSYRTLDMVVSSPAVSNGAVYFGSYDHLVYAVGGSSPNPQTYEVSFTASGLPQETDWTVTFNNQTENGTSDTIVFNVPNGVYSFSVASPNGYTASPESGNVTVDGANVNQQIIFSPATQEFPWVPVALIAVGAALLALAIAASVRYRKKH